MATREVDHGVSGRIGGRAHVRCGADPIRGPRRPSVGRRARMASTRPRRARRSPSPAQSPPARPRRYSRSSNVVAVLGQGPAPTHGPADFPWAPAADQRGRCVVNRFPATHQSSVGHSPRCRRGSPDVIATSRGGPGLLSTEAIATNAAAGRGRWSPICGCRRGVAGHHLRTRSSAPDRCLGQQRLPCSPWPYAVQVVVVADLAVHREESPPVGGWSPPAGSTRKHHAAPHRPCRPPFVVRQAHDRASE